jgi:catechol 2,3-dioxygenase-like lactoylglutathione lyase family enzyme
MGRGFRIDHVGVTVPDIDAATAFFAAALDAVFLYDVRHRTEVPRSSTEVHGYLGIPSTMAQGAIRMLALPEGPGLELFEYLGPDQHSPAVPSDLGWQHVALYVDDIDAALEKVELAGGVRNSDPRELRGVEAGEGNRFVYTRTPWGSTLELVSYPTPQPYLLTAPRAKWAPWPTPEDAQREPVPALRTAVASWAGEPPFRRGGVDALHPEPVPAWSALVAEAWRAVVAVVSPRRPRRASVDR